MAKKHETKQTNLEWSKCNDLARLLSNEFYLSLANKKEWIELVIGMVFILMLNLS